MWCGGPEKKLRAMIWTRMSSAWVAGLRSRRNAARIWAGAGVVAVAEFFSWIGAAAAFAMSFASLF